MRTAASEHTLNAGTPSDALARLRATLVLSRDPAALAALDELERSLAPEPASLQVATLQTLQTRILESIANGVVTLSPEGTITTFNRAAETTFGISAANMLGRDAATIGAVIRKFPELLATFFRSGAVQLRAEAIALRADGSRLTLELNFSPLVIGGRLGVAMVVIDVTRQRRLEEAHAAQVTRADDVAASFSRYLAPHVVQALMKDPSAIRLGGERQRATMLFADVRGFTSIALNLPPERVVHILNAYFEEAVRVVFAHDGMLDKFYGDGFMAVFGPPRARGDDARRAVATAIALHDAVAALRTRLDYPLQISVGLASGDVVAGHFGSAERMDYTVIGDAVNLANGLQSAAPPGQTYCDAATIAAAGPLRDVPRRLEVRLKGRGEPIAVYALRSQRAGTGD